MAGGWEVERSKYSLSKKETESIFTVCALIAR